MPARTLLLGLALSLLPCIAGAELALVRNGEAASPIILAPDTPPRTRAAAVELAEMIGRITGARPELLDSPPATAPETAVWIGLQPGLESRFPGVDLSFQHPEEVLLAANANHLLLAGRDRWDSASPMPQGRTGPIPDTQQEYGTANAIYTFLQDYLGVRWFWPGPAGVDVSPRKTLSIAPFEYRYHPPFQARALFRLSVLGDERGISHDWVRRQRLQLDSLKIDPGHAFSQWWERFHQTHPEYFALQPDGTRSLSAFYESPPERWPHLVKLCLSNPAVWEQWLADVETALKENPGRTIFNASENDSFHRGICVCDNCRAWDAPSAEKYDYTWKGLHEKRDGLSDRYARFWNTLARKLEERYPGRGYRVQGMAYGFAREAPAREKCEENVIVLPVANTVVAPEATRQPHLAYLRAWGRLAPLVWRPNAWTRAGKWGLPEVSIANQPENFRTLAESRGLGMIVDTAWEHWATHAPQYYLMAQLAWNPYLDADALMADYYQRAFGPAAEPVRRYWAEMERLMDHPLGQPVGLSDAFLARAERLLDAAAAKTADGPEAYRARVAFVRGGLTYTRLMATCLDAQRHVVEEQLKTGERDDPQKDPAVAAAWEKLEAWVKANPGSINPRYLRAAASAAAITSPQAGRRYLEYLSNLRDSETPGGASTDLDLPAGEF
ncbi:MAG TPA: DUF4838 domain-containing protein [Chthoniobacteraceae bacterium]|nr:DUF4838 domain-containing protein [Chthoniobacteraceae bacterium]